MLILSKFHDYYDTAIAFGVDKTIVYDRKQEELERHSVLRFDRSSRYSSHQILSDKHVYTYQRHVIGFTGNIYPILEITKYTKRWSQADREIETKFFYNNTELEQYFNDEEMKNTISWWSGFEDLPFGKVNTKTFFSQDTWSKYKDTFIKHKVPVFLLSNEELVLNPTLKDYKFAKIKDPFTAFQDIMQYISGVLGVGEPNMVDISNNDMRDKKGFNNWSFKTHPTDAKKPRKRKR